jgi:hypothetical protein
VTGQRRSLRKIADELAAAGHLTGAKYRGSKVARKFNPGSIKATIEGPMPATEESWRTLSGNRAPCCYFAT